MQKKILAIVAIVIVVIAAFAAWQFIPKTSSYEIKIGLVAPSGQPIGQDMQRAADLAVKEINDAGGIYVAAWHANATIRLVSADTIDDTPGNAVTPVTRAVETDKVDLLIGGYGSAGTLANEVVAIENKVPYIITGASNQLVTRRGPQGNYGGLNSTDAQAINDRDGMSYVFHYCTTTYQYSQTVLSFFNDVMKPMVAPDRDFRLAILYRNDAFGTGVEKAAVSLIASQNLPIDVVADRSYDPKTTNYQTDLTAIAEAHPDAIFVAENPDKTPLIIKQGWNDVGLKTVYIAPENNQDPAFYQLLGSAGAGQLIESKLDPFMVPSYLPAVQQYTERFNQAYPGIMPGMMGAGTYDAFYIAKDAIERAGSVDKAAVRDAIESGRMNQMLFMTETGKIEFSTGTNYHEFQPVRFVEQTYWDQAANQLKSRIVWPNTAPGVGTLKQADFVLPTGYEAGHP